ncbi:8416_t:CDS:1 [Racocetra fulgida]|uniref:8416_t:CDS:1 n=1 Tax=Racocetra fulgida TaxID=60492 RepID=A0A9N9EZT4_9GLOM|nr:8416_t:CDS:1 [Racocetra fulgida]
MSTPSKLDTSCPPLSTLKLPRLLASVPPTSKHTEISAPPTLPHNTSAFSTMNNVNDSYQQDMPNTETTVKPLPNKRGRKPLTTMPSAKKHYQNLKNQRAFRQRRANYVQELEEKATTFEKLYNDVLKENKILKEKLRSLKRQYSTDCEENEDCEENDGCDSEQKCKKAPANKKGTNSSCKVVKRMDDDDDVASCDENSTIQSPRACVQTSCHKPNSVSYDPSTNQKLPSLTPDTLPSINFNRQPKHQQVESHPSLSIEDIIMKEPLFCTTEEGDLCFCDPSHNSPNHDCKKLIVPQQFVAQYTNSIYSTLPKSPLNSSSEWQQEDIYYAQSPSPTSTTSLATDESTLPRNHPLNLNWILDTPEEDTS